MSVCGGLEKPLISSYGVGGRALHRSQVGCEGCRACGWVVNLILMRRCGGAAAKSCGRARAQCIDRFCDYDLVTNSLL